MTTPPDSPPVVRLDPAGIPVLLSAQDGEERAYTAWGLVEVPGAAALVLTKGEPPTMANGRALADALDDDPENPHMHPGSRAWEKERADGAEASVRRRERELERQREVVAYQNSRLVWLRKDLSSAEKRTMVAEARLAWRNRDRPAVRDWLTGGVGAALGGVLIAAGDAPALQIAGGAMVGAAVSHVLSRLR